MSKTTSDTQWHELWIHIEWFLSMLGIPFAVYLQQTTIPKDDGIPTFKKFVHSRSDFSLTWYISKYAYSIQYDLAWPKTDSTPRSVKALPNSSKARIE